MFRFCGHVPVETDQFLRSKFCISFCVLSSQAGNGKRRIFLSEPCDALVLGVHTLEGVRTFEELYVRSLENISIYET